MSKESVRIDRNMVLRDLFLLIFLLCVVCRAWGSQPVAIQISSYHLNASNLAVVVNDADPASLEVGEYYRRARGIPLRNMIHVRIDDPSRNLSPDAFASLKSAIDAQLLAPDLARVIQGMVLIWTTPYAVACNSITSALTMGFDQAQCRNSCAPGKPNPYFDSTSADPETDLGIRLTMLLPIESVTKAKALIDRGVASHAVPASAYLLSTSDAARNVRARYFPPSGAFPQRFLMIRTLHADAIENVDDVMFYSTGMKSVAKLDSIHFLPGALADHLTSFGGDLLGTEQMSSLRWLDAGATASYGTVSEPCNYPQKFPQPGVLMKQYLSGATAMEAYWKSVAWPAQGLIIGEPLAAPYR